MAHTAATLLQATLLTRQGHLADATRVIQQALGFDLDPETPGADKPGAGPADADISDIAFRELPAVHVPAGDTPTPASFTLGAFPSAEQQYPYRLYVPSQPVGTGPLPVVVMLHGCKQDADDFARGTAMNEVAEREKFLVVYPEQLRRANTMGCWNWFEPAHRRRGEGEPAMIAALATHIVATHGGDPDRVYIAGLSAGGAMAAVVGELYPDVFAATGIHSGLPPEAARDVTSAFTAMRKGAGRTPRAHATAIPTIVFHGAADKTVTPANSDAIVREQLAVRSARGEALALEETSGTAGPTKASRSWKRARWVDGQGHAVLESWTVMAAPHAWSGGASGGSYTDPRGPDASAAIASFFLSHRRG